jgi:hypothetical protein
MNTFESNFEIQADSLKWRWLNQGWPDYLVWKEGKISFVEVKGPRDTLRPGQLRMLDILSYAGLEVSILPNGNIEQAITVDQYLSQNGLVRVVNGGVPQLTTFNKVLRSGDEDIIKIYPDNSWVRDHL